MSAHRERGTLLMRQNRLAQAADEFRQALGEDPQDAVAHGFLALCLADMTKLDDAEHAAAEAVRHGPDLDLGHYAFAAIYLHRNRFPEAQRSAAEAIRINPGDPANFAMMARTLLAQRQWRYAREAAEAGLAIDAEHVDCLNLRARALGQLGDDQAARDDIEAALARDPENADSHANAGWAALRAGDHRAALDHFKETLRIDPTLDYARAGVVEAVKARNFLYSLMLKYFFWMGRLSRRAQWAVIIGGYFLFRILRQTAKRNPDLAPWIWPLMGLYLLWVFLSWTADPLSNLLLRLHPYGRLALSRDQIVASNALGAVLLGALAGLTWWLVTDNPAGLVGAAGCLFLSIPVSATYSCEAGWPRRAAGLYTLALAGVGIVALAFWLAAPTAAPGTVTAVLGIVFVIGVLASSWVANALIAVTPRR